MTEEQIKLALAAHDRWYERVLRKHAEVIVAAILAKLRKP